MEQYLKFLSERRYRTKAKDIEHHIISYKTSIQRFLAQNDALRRVKRRLK